MATQSTAIAEATRKNSSAMKVIAVLTMILLPGTAVSTMFSMPIIFGVTDDSRVTTNPSFWIYWAVTILLTLAVLGT
ncbi:hypothetical protein VTL71DRAFT_13292 [Oculimacula yallundae]|uniref:Uncharacterized protein n=1 Tax=Oculimacula yallundae TaxID=86028 RepID=A0ABR4CLF2_9HELO